MKAGIYLGKEKIEIREIRQKLLFFSTLYYHKKAKKSSLADV